MDIIQMMTRLQSTVRSASGGTLKELQRRSKTTRSEPGFRSAKKKKKGSVERERSAARSRPLGKPGRNSGRGKNERYDFEVGSLRDVVAIDFDHKETEAGSYKISLKSWLQGTLISKGAGYNFGLQIKFLDGKRTLADLSVVPTEVLDALIASVADGKES